MGVYVRGGFVLEPENDNFLTKQSPFLSPNFIRGTAVIVIPNNVELCKQYFLQEYLLLIRKSCN